MTSITLSTTQIAALVKAVPTIVRDIEAGKAPLQVLQDVEPQWLPIVEMVASDLFPFGGLAVDVIALAIFNQKKLTPQQQANYDAAYNARMQTI